MSRWFSNMTCENWIYILSVAFQMSASIMMLFGMITKKQADKSIEQADSYKISDEYTDECLTIFQVGLSSKAKTATYSTIHRRFSILRLPYRYIGREWTRSKGLGNCGKRDNICIYLQDSHALYEKAIRKYDGLINTLEVLMIMKC